jgi:WD40 repeat protein
MPFHVFLSHSSADKPAVEELARRLAKEGIQAWLDKWHLIPGDPWQSAIEKALAESETCAVFVGPSDFSPWQNEEMRAAIDQRVRDSGKRFRVIPVLLPGAKRAERSSLPTFLAATTWVEFRGSLENPDAFHRLVCGIRGIEPGAGPGQALYQGQCPYRGLRVFDVDDAPFFFGREALVQWLLNQVRPATEGQAVNRFLAIVGASGSGKSSVARAGLVATLKHDAIPGSARWPMAICRPGPDPLESLAVALSSAVNVGQGTPALAELIAEFQKNEKTLHLIARQSLRENGRDVRLVVVMDQFEEVFTLCRKVELREALIRNLLYAAKVTQGQTLVILTMRADFYGKCAANAELADAFSDHHVLVGPMTDDDLRRAIEMPAQLVGCELEAGLVDLLLQDVHQQPGALPLLQHALLELWNKSEGRRLTVKAYHEIGKLEGALQRRADATLKAFSAEEQELCRRTFLRLTQPGEGIEDTKRRASMQELLSLSGESSAEEAIIQKLAGASLLTTEADLINQDAFVEVAHEALIRNWPRLRKWIDVDRAGLRTRTRLTEAVREWRHAGRDTTYLYSGARLAGAAEWADSHPGELSSDEAEFLRCSGEAQQQREATELEVARKLAKALRERAEEAEKRTKEQKEAASKLRRRAIVASGAAAVAVILLAMFVVMWRAAEEQARIAAAQRSAAEEQARIAESRRLAAESSSALTKYPQRSSLLAVEALKVVQPLHGVRVAAAEQSLREALGFIGGRPLVISQLPTSAVAISADNHWLVTGNDNKTARLWDLHAKDPAASLVVVRGHKGAVHAVTISADNHWLVTGSDDKTARLWNLSAKDPAASPVVFRGHDGPVRAVAISADNRWLVTGSDDKTARLWDLSAKDPGASPVVLRGHDGPVNAVGISADNHWLVTGSDDKTARLWNLSAKDPAASPVVLRGHDGPVNAVGISADNHWLVTGSDDNATRLWDLRAKDPWASPVMLSGHDGSIRAVAISADNHWLVTGSDDKTARLWDLSAKNPAVSPVVFRGHDWAVRAVAISADNHWLVTGSDDKTARLWDLSAKDPAASPVVLRGHKGPVYEVAISTDDHWLVTGNDDKTAWLWDLRDKDPAASPVVLRGHNGPVRAVAISADNHWLVTGSDDNAARLWDLRAKDPAASPVVLRGHNGPVNAVAISADNHWLVTGSDDNAAWLWDLRVKDPAASPVVLRGHDGSVRAVAISADNHWLVTGSDDKTARLWDLRVKDPAASPVVLRGHDGSVRAVAISADNHWLVTGSDDNAARLWDLSAKDPAASPVVLRGYDRPVRAVAISADNHWLVTSSDDKTARLWDLRDKDPAASPVVLRGHDGPVRAVAISADNHWLVTGSDDKTARLWPLQINTLIDLARVTVGRNFTTDEWKLYFPGERYHKTFPDLPGP